MKARSIWAVVAGAATAIAVTTLVDAALNAARVYPSMEQPLDDSLALLPTGIRFRWWYWRNPKPGPVPSSTSCRVAVGRWRPEHCQP